MGYCFVYQVLKEPQTKGKKMTTLTLTNGTVITEEIMSVSKFLGSLIIKLPWIQEKLDGLADNDEVIVVKQHAGIIGTFLVDVKAVA